MSSCPSRQALGADCPDTRKGAHSALCLCKGVHLCISKVFTLQLLLTGGAFCLSFHVENWTSQAWAVGRSCSRAPWRSRLVRRCYTRTRASLLPSPLAPEQWALTQTAAAPPPRWVLANRLKRQYSSRITLLRARAVTSRCSWSMVTPGMRHLRYPCNPQLWIMPLST